MSFSASLTETIDIGGVQVTNTNSYTDSAQMAIDEAVANSETDYEIALVMDVSEIAMVYIVSDQDVTLEFNNSATGEPEMAMLAGVPYVWHTNSPFTNLLDTDITPLLYVTNTSGEIANIQIRFLYDSTP